jgi:hypothetical protein
MWFTGVALAIAGVVIGLMAYNAGYSHGLAHSGTAVQVVRETGFPFFLFPLSFFLLFAVLRIGFWSRWRRGPWMRGPSGRGHVEDRFDEWHRTRHDEEQGMRR